MEAVRRGQACFRRLGASVRKDARHMAHLAAGPHRALAVKMHRRSGNIEPVPVILDLAADEVRHLDPTAADRLAERPAGHRADVLLELRHRGAVEGPMAGIMHPRRDLVDEDLAEIAPRVHNSGHWTLDGA